MRASHLSCPLVPVLLGCNGAPGRDGSYRYYMSERVVENDPKALGPAIMAGLQVAELSQ